MTNNTGASIHDAAGPWSRLWQAGVLHSCATGIQGNYDGEILAFWQRQFGTLGDGACVVDIGTGNGALLLLARDCAKPAGIGLELHGVDIADIDPLGSVPEGARRFAGIHFHPRTSACHLPFADGQVHMVCSQFGLEYAPRDAALREILRVAHPQGRIALVLHSDDSIVARVAVPQREGCAFLLSGCQVIEQARAMVPILFQAARARQGQANAPNPGADAVRMAFNRSAQTLMDATQRLPEARVLSNAAQRIGAALTVAADSPQRAEQMLHQLQDSLRDEDARLGHLQNALLSEAKLRALIEWLVGHGYRVEHRALEQRPGVKIGWSLEAVRD